MRVLEGNVEVREDEAFGHEGQNFIHRRIGVHVLQTRPEAEAAQFLREVVELRAHRTAVGEVELVARVDAVGGRVLTDDDQFLHARFLQVRGFANDVADRTRDEAPAQIRDDAEGAVMVAAFADLEVGVVLGREPHAAGGNELVPGIVRARKVLFDHGDHFVDAVGTRDAEDLRHAVQNEVAAVGFLAAAEAPADDDAAVFLESFRNRLETFFNRFVHETAGVDDHEVGVVVAAPDAVAAGAQFGDDPFRVDERLGTAKRDETDDGDGVLHT